MAFGPTELFNNINDSGDALSRIFQAKALGLYPENSETKKVISEFNIANWNKSFPYVFSVEGNDASGFGSFELPINPSELAQDEAFAKTIRPTQGGTTINRSGTRYKELILSGTTGIAPFRGAGGAESSTGRAIFQPDTLKYRSGYEVFHLLRNWFRAYEQWKATDNSDKARQARMVFKNFKDGEFLIVELLKFSLKKSASRANLYDYNLLFKVIGTFALTSQADKDLLKGAKNLDTIISDVKDKIDTARGIFLRSQDILRQVESTYESSILEPLRKASLAGKAFLGVGTVAADMGKQAISNTLTEAAAIVTLLEVLKKPLSPQDQDVVSKGLRQLQLNKKSGNETSSGGTAVTKLLETSDVLMKVDSSVFPAATQKALEVELNTATALPRSFYSDALDDLVRIRDNAVDKFNLGSSIYNDQYQRVSTESASPTKIASDSEIELLYGFSLAISGLEKLIAANSLFGGTYIERLQNIQDQFTDDLGLKPQDAVKQLILEKGVDLERLAQQELGDSSRWIEIAELNDLKPPYIIQDQSDATENVLHPGEVILIPAPVISGFSQTPKGKPTYFTESLSEIEKNLGVDLKMTSDFDLQLSNRGDLEIVKGLDNAAQAFILKLMYEVGDLIRHPQLGIGLNVGGKFPSLTEIKSNLFRTLSADPRFEAIKNMEIVRDGSALKLKLVLHVKSVDIPIPITIPL